MRDEYDIMDLHPRRNPYRKVMKKRVKIDLDEEVVAYFKKQSEAVGIPYQMLISLYLSDCVKNNRHLEILK